jgi:hypothetical protein
MTCAQYLELLEWTGRQAHPGKVGRIPPNEPPILQQLAVAGEGWLKLVASFHTKRKGLRRAIGRPAALEAEAAKRGQRWIQGIALSREIFGKTPSDHSPEANCSDQQHARHKFEFANRAPRQARGTSNPGQSTAVRLVAGDCWCS